MSSKLPVAIDLAPMMMIGWQLVVPTDDLQVVSRVLLMAAVLGMGWILSREIRPKPRRVLILGSGSIASTLIEEIESSPKHRYVVAGVVDDERPDADSAATNRWLGPCDRLAEIVELVRPERIVVAISDRRDRLPLQSLLETRVRGIVVDDALDFYEHVTGKMAIEALRPSMLILGKGFRNHGAANFTTRVMSITGAIVGVLLAAPLLLVTAIAIKVDSPGPILFVRDRAGRNGRPFRLLKFRTMRPCDEERSEWVQDNADRITRVGKWLRRFRIDELPQLVNVLRGDMNLIGPRPHPTSNQAIFMEHIAYYGLRSTVHPGVTGWAQVRYGYANNLAEETEKMRYDLYYIKNRTLWLDLRILLETIGCVLMGHGAAGIRCRPVHREVAWRPARTRSGDTPMPWLTGHRTARHHAGRQ